MHCSSQRKIRSKSCSIIKNTILSSLQLFGSNTKNHEEKDEHHMNVHIPKVSGKLITHIEPESVTTTIIYRSESNHFDQTQQQLETEPTKGEKVTVCFLFVSCLMFLFSHLQS